MKLRGILKMFITVARTVTHQKRKQNKLVFNASYKPGFNNVLKEVTSKEGEDKNDGIETLSFSAILPSARRSKTTGLSPAEK